MIRPMVPLPRLVAVLGLFAAASALPAQDRTPPAPVATLREESAPDITRVWLSHRSHDSSGIVINWLSDEPGDSVVRFGTTSELGQTVRVAGHTQLHHVEIPLGAKDTVYHYQVSTGQQRSAVATFKGYPTDILRVVVAADWQGKPDLAAIVRDDPHLLLTAGDQISSLYEDCGPGQADCIRPYAGLKSLGGKVLDQQVFRKR